MSNVQSDWTRHGRCWSNSTREEHSVCREGSTISNLVLNFTPLPHEALHGDQSDHSVTLNHPSLIVIITLSHSKNSLRMQTDWWTAYPADRIDLLLRSRRARWSHAFVFLDERHKWASFTATTIAESPRAHFYPYSARVRTFGPLAPLGGFAKWVPAASRRNHIIVAFFLASEK